ncbi:hypothetical protein Tcan_01162, partial [Toxocara canis]
MAPSCARHLLPYFIGAGRCCRRDSFLRYVAYEMSFNYSSAITRRRSQFERMPSCNSWVGCVYKGDRYDSDKGNKMLSRVEVICWLLTRKTYLSFCFSQAFG